MTKFSPKCHGTFFWKNKREKVKECQVPLPLDNFKDHYDCVSFGYDFSHKMITNLSREFVNKQGAYIKFFCEETPKVST